MKTKEKAMLFGPFIGEEKWEIFYFAPMVNHVSSHIRNHKIIVFTRPHMFDFYGQRADIFVPLNIKETDGMFQTAFTIDGYPRYLYNDLVKKVYHKYKKKYNVVGHYYPQINPRNYNDEKQFEKREKLYDMISRMSMKYLSENFVDINSPLNILDVTWIDNNKLKDNLLTKFLKDQKDNILVLDKDDENGYFYNIENRDDPITINKYNTEVSFYGIVSILIKVSNTILTDISSTISYISLICKKPILTYFEHPEECIKEINPHNIEVKSISQDIDKYFELIHS